MAGGGRSFGCVETAAGVGGGTIGAGPPLPSPATSGSTSHSFCPVPLDKVGRHACWGHVCQVMTARVVRAGIQGLPALRLWGSRFWAFLQTKDSAVVGRASTGDQQVLGSWHLDQEEGRGMSLGREQIVFTLGKRQLPLFRPINSLIN